MMRRSKKANLMKLNDNEITILAAMAEADEFDGRPTFDVDEITEATSFTKSQVKGYFSDLKAKGFLIECEMPDGFMAMQLLGETTGGSDA